MQDDGIFCVSGKIVRFYYQRKFTGFGYFVNRNEQAFLLILVMSMYGRPLLQDVHHPNTVLQFAKVEPMVPVKLPVILATLTIIPNVYPKSVRLTTPKSVSGLIPIKHVLTIYGRR